MIKMKTSMGEISIELDWEKAPETCRNFVQYARDGFYDGTIFHRVIDSFMIQGGGFEPGMIQKTTRDQIKNEADNGLKNDRGTIAMARTGDPHSATAQFFINIFNNDSLNHSSPTPQGQRAQVSAARRPVHRYDPGAGSDDARQGGDPQGQGARKRDRACPGVSHSEGEHRPDHDPQ